MPDSPLRRRRGRTEDPIIGYGPKPEFGRKLRARREQAGKPTRRAMAKAGSISASSASAADSGKELPSPAILAGYLVALDADDSEQAAWSKELDEAQAAAAPFQPQLIEARTTEDMVAALWSLVVSQQLTIADLCDRIDETAQGHPSGLQTEEVLRITGLPPHFPDGDEVAGVFDHTVALTTSRLKWLVFAAGGASSDCDHWADHLLKVDGLRKAPRRQTASEQRSTVQPRTGRSPRTRRWFAAFGIVGLILLGSFGLPRLLRHTDRTPEPALSTRPAPPAGAPKTAHDVLHELAGRVCLTTEPSVTEPSSFYIRRVMWSVETTGGDGGRTIEDQRTWWNPADRSGRRETSRRGSDVLPTPYVERFGPGQFTPSFSGEPSTDQDVLTQQLTENHPARVGPARVLRGAVELNDDYVLSAAQTCALLQALADAPGLTYQDHVLDQLGRPGIAVSADDMPKVARDMLIIDSETGQVLGYDTFDISRKIHVQTSSAAYVERERVAILTD